MFQVIFEAQLSLAVETGELWRFLAVSAVFVPFDLEQMIRRAFELLHASDLTQSVSSDRRSIRQ